MTHCRHFPIQTRTYRSALPPCALLFTFVMLCHKNSLSNLLSMSLHVIQVTWWWVKEYLAFAFGLAYWSWGGLLLLFTGLRLWGRFEMEHKATTTTCLSWMFARGAGLLQRYRESTDFFLAMVVHMIISTPCKIVYCGLLWFHAYVKFCLLWLPLIWITTSCVWVLWYGALQWRDMYLAASKEKRVPDDGKKTLEWQPYGLARRSRGVMYHRGSDCLQQAWRALWVPLAFLFFLPTTSSIELWAFWLMVVSQHSTARQEVAMVNHHHVISAVPEACLFSWACCCSCGGPISCWACLIGGGHGHGSSMV